MPNDKPFVHPYWGLLLGAVAVSFAAVFIRIAAAPPLVTSAYRLSIATLILLPWAARPQIRAEWARLTRREWILAIVSGVLLAIHFASWIASLDYTTVASSAVLVGTYPLFVALASPILLRESVSKNVYLGVIVAVCGSMIISASGFSACGANLSGQMLFGDLLALVGALAGAGYFMVGRRLRGKLSLIGYTFVVYGVAALTLVGSCLLTRQVFTGYPVLTYLMFVLLAVVPQNLGHSSFNWAMRYLPAAFVVTPPLAEPIGASILAFFILHEAPTRIELVGGALVLLGIYITVRARVEK